MEEDIIKVIQRKKWTAEEKLKDIRSLSLLMTSAGLIN